MMSRIALGIVVAVGLMALAGCNKAGDSGSGVQATTQQSLDQNKQRGADTARQLANMGRR